MATVHSTSNTTSSASNDPVWIYWNSDSCTVEPHVTCTGGSMTITDGIWDGWNTATSTSATTTTSNDTWTVWVEDDTTARGAVRVEHDREDPTPNQEDIEAARLNREEDENRYKELKAKKEAAEQKAKDLLLDLIGEEQLKVYEETGKLLVHGRQFDYIVQKSGFVKKIEKEKILDLCVHLKEKHAFPETDNVISMKLMLEEREEEVLRLANVHHTNPRPDELPMAACM